MRNNYKIIQLINDGNETLRPFALHLSSTTRLSPLQATCHEGIVYIYTVISTVIY